MVSTSVFSLIAILASAFVARADVNPSEPSPGSVYREGQTCPITWDGDLDSTTVWKNMNIELMTGDNFNMIHITSKSLYVSISPLPYLDSTSCRH